MPKIELTVTDWRKIVGYLATNPAPLYFDRRLRTFIAKRHAESHGKVQTFESETQQIIEGAIDYNQRHMRNFLESHVVRLIRPLSVIDPIYEQVGDTKVLSIGPFNENELLHLAAYGFDLEKIDAIDLVSNSPRVRIMDMHHLEFADDSYDVLISGWTLPYSREPRRALAEKMRVLKSGGLLCIGLTREPPTGDEAALVIGQGATNYLSVDQILADIEAPIEKVEFRHEPRDPARKGAILLIIRAA